MPSSNPDVYAILEAAAQIARERGATRDQGDTRSMARTVAAFNAVTGHEFTETDGWVFLLILKLGRAHGGNFHADDWLDQPGYAALAAESAIKASRNPEEG